MSGVSMLYPTVHINAKTTAKLHNSHVVAALVPLSFRSVQLDRGATVEKTSGYGMNFGPSAQPIPHSSPNDPSDRIAMEKVSKVVDDRARSAPEPARL
jgi:hypothetical protein